MRTQEQLLQRRAQRAAKAANKAALQPQQPQQPQQPAHDGFGYAETRNERETAAALRRLEEATQQGDPAISDAGIPYPMPRNAFQANMNRLAIKAGSSGVAYADMVAEQKALFRATHLRTTTPDTRASCFPTARERKAADNTIIRSNLAATYAHVVVKPSDARGVMEMAKATSFSALQGRAKEFVAHLREVTPTNEWLALVAALNDAGTAIRLEGDDKRSTWRRSMDDEFLRDPAAKMRLLAKELADRKNVAMKDWPYPVVALAYRVMAWAGDQSWSSPHVDTFVALGLRELLTAHLPPLRAAVLRAEGVLGEDKQVALLFKSIMSANYRIPAGLLGNSTSISRRNRLDMAIPTRKEAEKLAEFLEDFGIVVPVGGAIGWQMRGAVSATKSAADQWTANGLGSLVLGIEDVCRPDLWPTGKVVLQSAVASYAAFGNPFHFYNGSNKEVSIAARLAARCEQLGLIK